jgi:hypothetical protein
MEFAGVELHADERILVVFEDLSTIGHAEPAEDAGGAVGFREMGCWEHMKT